MSNGGQGTTGSQSDSMPEGRRRVLGLSLQSWVALFAVAAAVGVVWLAVFLSGSKLTQPQATAIAGTVAGSAALFAAGVTGALGWSNRTITEKQIRQAKTIADDQLAHQNKLLENLRTETSMRRTDDAVRGLRDRYTTIAGQLGHDAAPVRLSGVYGPVLPKVAHAAK